MPAGGRLAVRLAGRLPVVACLRATACGRLPAGDCLRAIACACEWSQASGRRRVWAGGTDPLGRNRVRRSENFLSALWLPVLRSNRTIVGLLPAGEFLRASSCGLPAAAPAAGCLRRLPAPLACGRASEGECGREQTALAAVECGRWENFFLRR